ncbi:hypothetical protein [Pseudoalteromonas luteoviolacea]|uniref:Uncharacterized protein n=1 Tax=Pseudoalteromonas luteoviolacea S4060-1 TaxID=1365257 RepID=A0A167JR93_9GAMM|nr:hypothetical protein [Pseudoalteromonas luteoviolacea]KZN61545.1 hypothetical protein N478_05580 [Pseudoalteromonas luteoviolacea S4060-1]
MTYIKDQDLPESQELVHDMANLLCEQANEAINLICKRDTSSARISCEDVLIDLLPMAKLLDTYLTTGLSSGISNAIEQLLENAESITKVEVVL